MISVFQCTLSDNKSTWLFGKRLFEHAPFLILCLFSFLKIDKKYDCRLK